MMTVAAIPILIIQNNHRPHAGWVERLLHLAKLPYEIILLDDALPTHFDYRGVIVLGGPASANDQSTKILAELDYIKEVLNRNLPYLGICLGHQLLAKAVGLTVQNASKPESGPCAITLTDLGVYDQLFQNVLPTSTVFQHHGEIVVPSNELSVLATGVNCVVQSLKIGPSAYGVQFHPEITLDIYRLWEQEDATVPSLTAAQFAEYEQTGKTILSNWIKLLS